MKWNRAKTVNDKRGLNGKKLTERGRSGLRLRQRGPRSDIAKLGFSVLLLSTEVFRFHSFGEAYCLI